jgi:membrane AbrB-like protein
MRPPALAASKKIPPLRALIDDFGTGLRGLAPTRFPYPRFVAAVLLSLVGAWVFLRLGMPLPWMLGPLTFCTVGAVLNLPIAAPKAVQPPMLVVVGVMLGSTFSPSVIGHLGLWFPTAIGLLLNLIASAFVCVLYFRLVARFDPVTAYFSGVPGGLMEMITMGEEKGGDVRTIALVHSARLLLILLTIPFIIQLIGDVDFSRRGKVSIGGDLELALDAMLGLLLIGIVGVIFGHVSRLPAKYMIGPMAVSALVHILDWSNSAPPTFLVNTAQLVMGAAVGCRFLGAPHRELARVLLLSLGSIGLLLAVTLAFAYGVSQVSDYGTIPLFLAYSPGGLTEMSLVALALQLEVAFVAGHHLLRVAFVVAGAGLIAKLTLDRR